MRLFVSTCSLILAGCLAGTLEAREEITTASGLKYEVIAPGADDAGKPQMFSMVKVHYTGTLTDGTKFDSSRDRGEPAQFRLGEVIEGWNEGLQLMSPGARFKFTIPSELGYGDTGMPPSIPPKATLVFDVELLSFDAPPPMPAFQRCAADAKKTESGIVYEVVTKGSDKAVSEQELLVFHFTAWTAAGRAFVSTHTRSGPAVGKAHLMRMPFLQQSLALMQEGSTFRFEAPNALTFPDGKLPAGVKADEPTIWLLEIDRFVDMAKPTFAMPKDEETTKTASGLRYKILREGKGEPPRPNQSVTVNYAGWLVDGKQFDSSYDRGQPAQFGVSQVIPGWTEGLQLMKPGTIALFVIPPEIAYGAQGAGGDIPPNSTLVFHVELIAIR